MSKESEQLEAQALSRLRAENSTMTREWTEDLIRHGKERRALEAQLAAMTAERDEALKQHPQLLATIRCMEIERDALLVGAAYAAAAEWCRKNERHGSIPAYNILRLTPADAATAIDHIRAQAKADVWAEAVKIAEDTPAWIVRDAILAAAQKEAGK